MNENAAEINRALDEKITPWIETRSGKHFDLVNPTLEMISRFDIAHALGNLCRFTGHINQFYSVAEHSVLMCRWAKDHGWSLDDQQAVLFHDAHEAFVGDMSWPLKVALPEYAVIEERVAAVVRERLKIPHPLPDEIKLLDKRMLATEASLHFIDSAEWVVADLEPLDVVLQHWVPPEASGKFHYEFGRILADRQFPDDE